MDRQQLWRIALLVAVALLAVCFARTAPGSAAAPALAAAGETAAQLRPTAEPSPTQGSPRPPLTPGPGATDIPGKVADRPAKVCLRLLADPNIAIQPGELASYQLVAQNRGRGRATAVQLAFFFNPDEQVIRDAAFSSPTAWVTALHSDTVDVSLGPLEPNAIITSTLRLRVHATTASSGVLLTAADLHWSDSTGDHTGRSNQLDLIVGQAPASAPTIPLTIDPATGEPTTNFSITYDRFAANEDVSLWYHEPSGRAVALGQTRADGQGRVALNLAAETLPAGRLRLVAYGQCSRVTAVGTAIVAHK